MSSRMPSRGAGHHRQSRSMKPQASQSCAMFERWNVLQCLASTLKANARGRMLSCGRSVGGPLRSDGPTPSDAGCPRGTVWGQGKSRWFRSAPCPPLTLTGTRRSHFAVAHKRSGPSFRGQHVKHFRSIGRFSQTCRNSRVPKLPGDTS